MATIDNLRRAAINRHRKRLFGDSSLKLYTTTPAAGEAEVFNLAADWRGRRITATTDSGAESGAWQFEIVANADWVTSQANMLKVVALTIDSRRWKIAKVEKPIGTSFVWKLRAQIQ